MLITLRLLLLLAVSYYTRNHVQQYKPYELHSAHTIVLMLSSQVECRGSLANEFEIELCAAAADHMSASRRRRFRGVLMSCRTPAILLLDFCNAVYNEA